MTVTTVDSVQLRVELAADNPPILIDVRTPAEFEALHVPSSYNIPLDQVGDFCHDLCSLERPVVLICRSGARATQADATLRANGARQVQVLEGGVEAWAASGGEVVHNETEVWAMDRQVRLVAGSLVLAGIVASLRWRAARFFSGAIGFGLVFSSVTNTCAMGNMLARLPYNTRGGSCDVDAAIADILAADSADSADGTASVSLAAG